jgi:glucose-1-phosphate cytidylyltransferase
MQTVILCGGKGLRYSSEIPKSLAMIGDKPIIQHLMDIYSHQEYNDFILCLGYKKDVIINYFNSIKHDFNIEFVDTGEESNTAERIRLLEKYIIDDDFFVTYSDGIADVNLDELLEMHDKCKLTATLTAVHPYNTYGIINIGHDGRVTKFNEKPKMKEFINAGFFAFNKKIFEYINKDEDLEVDILPRLCNEGLLYAYKHDGFWDTLNNTKDEIRLNELYNIYMERNIPLPWVYNTKKGEE